MSHIAVSNLAYAHPAVTCSSTVCPLNCPPGADPRDRGGSHRGRFGRWAGHRLANGVQAARLAGLLAPRPRVFGVPVGSKSGLVKTAELVGKAAKGLGAATTQVSTATDEARQLRQQLEMSNKRSPVELVLDGLTHRRGAHKPEN